MTGTEQFEVHNRFTNAVQFTATIECEPDASIGIKLGLAVRWALKNAADLRDGNLLYADLSGADLRGDDLRYADLRGANLRYVNLGDCPVKIQNIHRAVYEAASQPGALDMSSWHCATANCRAGWVVFLAGKAGAELEDKVGTPTAATLIYFASDPKLEKVPNFYAKNDEALADMKRLAELEDVA